MQPTRRSNHFTQTSQRVTRLIADTWYRSPLWSEDHLLGLDKAWREDGIAWCGRPLAAAMDMEDDEYGGLWVSDRRTGKCAECRRRQEEWRAR